VSGENSASETHIDDVNERLSAGIETCRSVVANYRSLLANDQAAVEQHGENLEISASPTANDP
jgi:hypothetical protein